MMDEDGMDTSIHGNCSVLPMDDEDSLALHSVEDLTKFFLDDESTTSSSNIVNNCLSYISGYVVKKVSPQICCQNCNKALLSSPEDCIAPEDSNLIIRKDRGNLPYQTDS